ncbi:hypothetical protein C8Q76DRAFT_797474 [Earliella scabrosa]|nr:hypothetical protein C8Q76DRAFT_797474 [Earliella scabrosa]
MTGEYEGPFFAVLGGKETEVVPKHRPAGVTGNYKPLLPVIVVCTTKKDAETVLKLNELIFNSVAPDDAHSMIYLLQVELDALKLDLDHPLPMYAVRAGAYPGIYCGFDWNALDFTLAPCKEVPNPRWQKYEKGDLKAAIAWMLRKPGAKLPILPAGVPMPPPPQRPKQLRFDLSNLSLGEALEERGPANPSRPSSPVKSVAGTSSRSASPVKGILSRPATTRASPSVAVMSAASPVSSAASSSTATPTLTNTLRAGPVSSSATAAPTASIRPAGATFDLPPPFHADPVLAMLRRFIRPPISMAAAVNPNLPAISFGPTADEAFMNIGLDGERLLTLLQVRVHSHTIETFTHHVGLLLGWETRDAIVVWNMLQMPEL